VYLKNIGDCMRSPNGSNHTTQTPPPLSFYNTFKKNLLQILSKVKKGEFGVR
jgi:hypothetical protein